MPVGTWTDPAFQTDTGTTYKTSLDNCIAVTKRVGDSFAPHAKTVPDMNVLVDAGAVFADQVVVEKTQQTIGPFTAPTVNPRIDRIVVDVITGVASIVAGAEAGSPVPPTIPDDKFPNCQIALSVGQVSITNANITDERILGVAGGRRSKDKVIADQTVGNTGTETTIYAKSIQNLLGSNKAIIVTLLCRAKQHSVGGATFIVRGKFGGTTLCTSAAIDIASTGFVGVVIQFLLFADGASNAQIGKLLVDSPNATLIPPASGSATEDSTTAKDVVVTLDWSSAEGANQSFVMEAGVMEQLS